MPGETPFWHKPLSALSDEEWEALCDGCGRCCMHRFIDEETGAIWHTDIACRWLDAQSCRCRCYNERHARVAACIAIRQLRPEQFAWLPASCAYRLRHEGKALPAWHPLRSGDPASVVAAGISMCNACTCEDEVPEDEWPAHVRADFQ